MSPQPLFRRGVPATVSVLLLGLVCLFIAACGVIVPHVVGHDLDGATKTLEEAGLVVGSVTYDPESTAATWTVVAQEASADRVSEGAKIDLVLSGGRPTMVPDLHLQTAEDAGELLSTAGLSFAIVEERFDETAPESAIVTQTPAPGTIVEEGRSVAVVVSLGPEPPPSDELVLGLIHKTSGPYSPKSVVASQNGFVFAQNMIYRHTITVFDDESFDVVETIPDEIQLSDYGFEEYSGSVKGGPVEAAATPDGKYMYVSNYSMYGSEFSRPGDDVGGPQSGVDPSFVYRIPTDTLKIDQVIKVGSVPKFLAVTPDGSKLLVSNWISYTLSVVDTATGQETAQVKLGRYPRGIAVSPDSSLAYVAVMGSRDIAIVDLSDNTVEWMRGVGSSPRHLVIDPEGRYLYATLNGDGTVAKIDLDTRAVVARVRTGSQPRSMSIAEDGRSLYVVNYESDSVSKVRTSDMAEMQELSVGHHPIGITYVNDTRDVWVCCYSGSFWVFRDGEPGE